MSTKIIFFFVTLSILLPSLVISQSNGPEYEFTIRYRAKKSEDGNFIGAKVYMTYEVEENELFDKQFYVESVTSLEAMGINEQFKFRADVQRFSADSVNAFLSLYKMDENGQFILLEAKSVGGNSDQLPSPLNAVDFGGLIEPALITFWLGNPIVAESTISAEISAYTNSELEYYKQMAEDDKQNVIIGNYSSTKAAWGVPTDYVHNLKYTEHFYGNENAEEEQKLEVTKAQEYIANNPQSLVIN